MKTQRTAVLIAFVFLSAISLIAQCGMYTYQDVTSDGNGNLVATNLVQATSCKESSTYAEAHLTMPSGAQFAATAFGSDAAEAVVSASFANESGSGSFSGTNSASSDLCGFSDGSTFLSPITLAIASTNYILNGLQGSECVYYLYCPNGNTAVTCPSGNPLYADATQNTCLNYLWDQRIRLNYNGTNHCFPIGSGAMSNVAHNCS